MDVSVSELKAAVSKAALGSGMPVGLAEENAAIAATLARLGADAVGSAARVLRSYAAAGAGRGPERNGANRIVLQADGTACVPAAWHIPLACLWLCGNSLRSVEAYNVDDLLWTAGALVRASERVEHTLAMVELTSERQLLACRQGQLITSLETLAGATGDAIVLRSLDLAEDVEAARPTGRPSPSRAMVAIPDNWRYLLDLGDRMLVESSEYSRLHGAGYVG